MLAEVSLKIIQKNEKKMIQAKIMQNSKDIVEYEWTLVIKKIFFSSGIKAYSLWDHYLNIISSSEAHHAPEKSPNFGFLNWNYTLKLFL